MKKLFQVIFSCIAIASGTAQAMSHNAATSYAGMQQMPYTSLTQIQNQWILWQQQTRVNNMPFFLPPQRALQLQNQWLQHCASKRASQIRQSVITNADISALFHACVTGSQGQIETLLEKNKENLSSFVNARDNLGASPLHRAAYYGNAHLIPALLAAGANVDAKNSNGKTPLHLAAYVGDVRIAQQLLNAKANADERDNDGKTPFDLAQQHGQIPVIRLLGSSTTTTTTTTTVS